MKTASVSEAKNSLSALLDVVRHGGTVVITDRGRPVAKLGPMEAGENVSDDAAMLDHLARAGIVTHVGSSSLPLILTEAPPEQPPGISALELLLAERDEGR